MSLLDGSTSIDDLTYVVGETYRISPAQARSLVDSVLDKTRSFLASSTRQELDAPRYDPKTFIFRISPEDANDCGPLDSPLALNIVLTKRCNFRCRYCYFDSCANTPEDLPGRKTLDLIEEGHDMGVVVIMLTGGEPLLYDGICEVVAAITERNMVPVISTNGSFLGSEMIEGLINAGLESIQVSLDAPCAEIHHFLTRTRNTFRTVLSGIQSLKSNGFYVRTNSVMTQNNYSHLEDLIDLLVDNNVDEIVITIQRPGSCESKIIDSSPELTEREIDYVRQKVEERMDEHDGHPRFRLNVEGEWQGQQDIIRCGNLHSSLVIHPSGNATICEMIENAPELSYGNVFESSLKEIWQGPSHQHLLDLTVDPSHIDKDCSLCENLDFCRTGCFNLSRLSEGDFFGKDPRCPGASEMRR
ncbi:MAG: radical SAM protein [Methanobacteriota archaeon]|nr:MAG: radical SAM protein [Euryarchaeota archaeon]